MNFWNNPENNSLKMVIVLIIVAFAGSFIYYNMHEGALEGTGQVARKGADIQKKNTDPRSWKCLDGGAGITLSSSKVPAPTMTVVSTALSNAVRVPWLTFKIDNPGDCPVDLSKMSFELTSNEITPWPPVQHMALIHLAGIPAGATGGAGTQLDGKKEVPGGVLPDEAIIPLPAGTVTSTGAGVSSHTFVFNFPGASSVRVYPHSTEYFRLVANSQNVPGNMYGYDGTVGSGTEVWFKLQLTEFLGTTIMGGGIVDHLVSAGTIPPTIITPVIKIH